MVFCINYIVCLMSPNKTNKDPLFLKIEFCYQSILITQSLIGNLKEKYKY